MPPRRRLKVSQLPYEQIVEALDNISRELKHIGSDLCLIRSATNLQTKYLEIIGRKINKKGFKRYFGKGK